MKHLVSVMLAILNNAQKGILRQDFSGLTNWRARIVVQTPSSSIAGL